MLLVHVQHVHWSSSLVKLSKKSNFYELCLTSEDTSQVTMESAGHVTNNMSLVDIDAHVHRVTSQHFHLSANNMLARH